MTATTNALRIKKEMTKRKRAGKCDIVLCKSLSIFKEINLETSINYLNIITTTVKTDVFYEFKSNIT